MTDAVRITAVALLWTGMLWRLPRAWRVREQRPLCAALGLLAAAMTASWTPVRHVGQWVDVPYLAMLAQHLFGVLAAAATLEFLAMIAGGNGSRWARLRHVGAVAAAVALLITFLAAPRQDKPAGTIDLLSVHPADPAVLAYGLTFLSYLVIVVAAAAGVAAYYGRVADPGALQVGLHLVAAGCVIGVVYLARRTVSFVGLAAGVEALRLDAAGRIPVALLATSLLLILIGTSAPLAMSTHRAVCQYWSLRRLYPLWRALYEANPHVVLDTPPDRVADVLTVRDLPARLYRRVIEIRDGILALCSYAPDGAYDRALRSARAYGYADPEATAEACWLMLACRSKTRGEPPGAALGSPLLGQISLAGEVQVLGRVSSSYQSPAVRRLADDLDRDRALVRREGR